MRKGKERKGKDDLLLFFQIFLCGGDTGHKNGEEFVVFLDERAELVKRFDQRHAMDNKEPYECFPQFMIHHSLLNIRYSSLGKVLSIISYHDRISLCLWGVI